MSKFLDYLLLKETPGDLLKKRTDAALVIFQKTVDDLNLINNEARTEIDKKEKEIENLQAEVSQLDGLMIKNAKVIGKINSILE